MKKIVLTFGVLSGLASVGMMAATVPFIEQIGFDNGVFVGYTAIVISFLFVYFGIRSYRDEVLGGRITFGTGFNVGILITLISCAFYVTGWLVLYYNFMPDFGDRYAAHLVETARASGATQAEIDVAATQGREMLQYLENPVLNAAVSFIEPFPVGLIMTVISSALLKKQEIN